MDTSAGEFRGTEHAGAARGDSRVGETGVPAELIREVATGLKTLSKVLSYEEYAAIVHRVAWLKWRCVHAPAAGVPDEASHLEIVPDDVAADRASGRLWQEILSYKQFLEMEGRTRALLERAARADADAGESVLVVASDRVRQREESEPRVCLRRAMSDFVAPLKANGETLDEVLRRTGHLLDLMREVGAAPDEHGELEADVMRVAAESYCAAA